jgi:hypothetical protein
MALHVLPLNDVAEHVLDTTCPCGCQVDFEKANAVITHSSFDGREWQEYDGESWKPNKLWTVVEE